MFPLTSSAWLTSYEHKVVDKINQRIEDITGLDVTTAEELQVTRSNHQFDQIPETFPTFRQGTLGKAQFQKLYDCFILI